MLASKPYVLDVIRIYWC